MADIKKTIECLKELEAKATPGPWEVGSCKTTIYDKDGSYLGDFDRAPHDDIVGDAALIVAMRNALPELLAELERQEACAERAEAERDALIYGFGHCEGCPIPRALRDQPLDCGHNGKKCHDALRAWAEHEAASTVK